MLQLIKKLKLYTKLPLGQYNMYSYQSFSWLVVYHHNLQNLYKGSSYLCFICKIGNFIWKYSCQSYCFFSQWSNIWYLFVCVVILIAAAFHAQMFFNCSNFLLWMSEWYLLFVPSLKWDLASQMEIIKQCLT